MMAGILRKKEDPENEDNFADASKDKRAQELSPSSRKYSIKEQQELEEEEENISKILENYRLTPNDTNDPSYTSLTRTYNVICRDRYRIAGNDQKMNLIKEIKAHEMLRGRALDGVRLHREFCKTIITTVNKKELITLTQKQKDRLDQLLSE